MSGWGNLWVADKDTLDYVTIEMSAIVYISLVEGLALCDSPRLNGQPSFMQAGHGIRIGPMTSGQCVVGLKRNKIQVARSGG